jgi:hypothetical protein
MIPAVISLSDHTRGDAWDGLHIGPMLEGASPPDTPVVSCRMHFRDKKGVLGYAFSNSPTASEGTITIVSAANYEFDVPRQLLKLEVGEWYWDFETTPASGLPSTWLKGKIKILQDQTYG